MVAEPKRERRPRSGLHKEEGVPAGDFIVDPEGVIRFVSSTTFGRRNVDEVLRVLERSRPTSCAPALKRASHLEVA